MTSFSYVSTVSDVARSPGLTTAGTFERYMDTVPRETTFKQEVSNTKFWKAVRTEFVSTMLLVVLGCGSCMRWEVPTDQNSVIDQNTPDVEVKVALAFGATVATLMQYLGPISGGHMNPAVSLAFLITRNITPVRACLYVLAQCLGSLAGAGILYGLTPVEVRPTAGLGVTRLAPDLHLSQAFGVEFLGTLIVVLTALANTQRTELLEFRAFGVGTAYTAAHLFAYRLTGAGLNPARSLGPAVVANTWTDHWVYWIGPLLGGIIGGFTFEYSRHDASGFGSHFRRKIPRESSAGVFVAGNETELTASFSNDLLHRV